MLLLPVCLSGIVRWVGGTSLYHWASRNCQDLRVRF
jgi:hypothetical protein